jgi:3-hydroxyisobutyrate dehydrogenase-like beta-hydroxyacid dehydrogenase
VSASTTTASGLPVSPDTAVGFVGLGRMGGAMASRVLGAGLTVYGTSRSRDRANDLVESGLRWCGTAREVAEQTRAIFSSIPDDRALEAIAEGPDGVLAGLADGGLWVEMSTVSPDASQRLASRVRERGAEMLDAPVSGSVPQARSGKLTIMVGGPDDAYAQVEPILRQLGSPSHIGANGHGLVLKLAINISLAVQMLAFAEGLVLAARSGLDPERAGDVMAQSAIGSPMLQIREPLIFDPPDEAMFDMSFMQKDVRLALEAARAVNAPSPTAERAVHRDIAELYSVLELQAAEPARAS